MVIGSAHMVECVWLCLLHVVVQVVHQIATHVEDTNHRLVEMCNNHPMFQFLFDEHGRLLTANKRAIMNMRGKPSACFC